MTIAVHIIATGARTPLGLESASSAAAVRAQICAMGEHPFMIDQMGDPMPAAMDAQLDPCLMGPQRLLALAEGPLREVCAPLTGNSRLPQVELPLLLALPELRPGFSEQDAETIRSGLAGLEGLPCRLSAVKVFNQGHAAGLATLATAYVKMQQGVFEACLVGGVDSYFQPDTMEWLDANRQLVGAVSRSGFVPGEGAGFCLLMSEPLRRRLELKSQARILVATTGRETKLIKTAGNCLGEGLTATVRNVLSVLAPAGETISDIVCDINGERYRGEEWGFVVLRLPLSFDDPTSYRSPADLWGDMGAASGPLFAMLACQAATRGYAKGKRTLLWGGSESGLRSAAVLGFDISGKKQEG